jgi:peptide/nickel transport system ATP-binding protein
MSTDPLLSLENVEVHFRNDGLLDRLFSRDQEVVKAVDDVSLDIYEEDVVAIVGESGCGKTTLGKTSIGLQRPTGGSVKYRGQDIWAMKDGAETETTYEEIRRSLQIIHQDPGSSLNSNRTVMSSLSDPLKRWHPDMTPDEREFQIYRLLERVGMKPAEDYASRFPHQLSGGEKQRVVLIRALLMEPDLILADEAVSALDVSLRVEMMDLMLELQDIVSTSFLFISHDFSNARYLAEKAGGRIGIMYLGRLVEIGPADTVLQNPRHPYTKVLAWATPPLDPELARKAQRTDPPVRDIDIPDPKNPPSGCRFHNRCPEAREACTQETPDLLETDIGTRSACFRIDDTHGYWNSDPLDAAAASDFESLEEVGGTTAGDDD